MAEVRRLVWGLIWARQWPAAFVLAWSSWRRNHQARAKLSHYQRRRARPTDLQL